MTALRVTLAQARALGLDATQEKKGSRGTGTRLPHPSKWEELFATQLRLSSVPFLREQRLVPGRRFRVDFCFPSRRLAVEIEGGVWSQGRHTRGHGFADDTRKYNALSKLGWTVLRYVPEDVRSGAALAEVMGFLLKGIGPGFPGPNLPSAPHHKKQPARKEDG